MGSKIASDKPIFVISDLHIGDGSKRDNLRVEGRETQLHAFLDYVERCDGELVVAGDLFEFWRYRVDKVLANRKELLDRLDAMNSIYILGNHDLHLRDYMGLENPPHIYLKRMRTSFMRTIGSKRVKFMHGHEVDPFIPARPGSLSRVFGTFWGMIEYNHEACTIHRDLVSDLLFELGENFLKYVNVFSRRMNKAVKEYYSLSNDKFAWLKRSLRVRKMLSRYHDDKNNNLYDIAVVGHTHKACRFNNWYFNSGSWTGRTNNFMVIDTDAKIEVFNWTQNGAERNDSEIERT